MLDQHLIQATHNLPPKLRRWVSMALRSGWFHIEPGDYDGRPHGGVCPVTAGAILAGVWADGCPKPGNPEWGTVDEPSAEVEDFAAYFDLCAKELGTEGALEIVQAALQENETPARSALSDGLAS